jgi:hypothetical protein
MYFIFQTSELWHLFINVSDSIYALWHSRLSRTLNSDGCHEHCLTALWIYHLHMWRLGSAELVRSTLEWSATSSVSTGSSGVQLLQSALEWSTSAWLVSTGVGHSLQCHPALEWGVAWSVSTAVGLSFISQHWSGVHQLVRWSTSILVGQHWSGAQLSQPAPGVGNSLVSQHWSGVQLDQSALQWSTACSVSTGVEHSLGGQHSLFTSSEKQACCLKVKVINLGRIGQRFDWRVINISLSKNIKTLPPNNKPQLRIKPKGKWPVIRVGYESACFPKVYTQYILIIYTGPLLTACQFYLPDKEVQWQRLAQPSKP